MLEPLHAHREIRLRGFHQQMIMIAHQHPGVNPPSGSPAGLAKRVQKEPPVIVIAHNFDPPGIGAKDLRECLLIQLKRAGREHSLESRIVSAHLPDVVAIRQA